MREDGYCNPGEVICRSDRVMFQPKGNSIRNEILPVTFRDSHSRVDLFDLALVIYARNVSTLGLRSQRNNPMDPLLAGHEHSVS